ncbi:MULTISPECIES: hypothetical protein [Antrihabitans]|uniref:Uncharacterized protein n=1 Tax=Antrihabitans stalagmiti TaxID=2799499 RepID=A0A934U7G1_9NOCA|nr:MULTISPECIES: hypothetical protein [Antrihabitans]MBJ8342978.1 hypothetical protein [Antrihabitans stalagmiti]
MSTLAEEDFEVGAHAQRLHESGTPWSAIRTELVCTSDTARRLANAYVTLADERARKDQLSLF